MTRLFGISRAKRDKSAKSVFPTRRLAICVPSNSRPTIGFTYSLCNFLLRLRAAKNPLDGWDVGLVCSDGSVIHDSREKLVEQAMRLNATHMLFLDDDMTFPPEVIFGLVARDKPFVACNYPRRIPPHNFTASRADLTNLIETTAVSSGLEPANGVGFGVTLIERAVFSAVPKPWFLPGWDAADGNYISEDVGFCRRASAAGFTPMVDHDASKLVGHLSSRTLTFHQAELLAGSE